MKKTLSEPLHTLPDTLWESLTGAVSYFEMSQTLSKSFLISLKSFYWNNSDPLYLSDMVICLLMLFWHKPKLFNKVFFSFRFFYFNAILSVTEFYLIFLLPDGFFLIWIFLSFIMSCPSASIHEFRYLKIILKVRLLILLHPLLTIIMIVMTLMEEKEGKPVI